MAVDIGDPAAIQIQFPFAISHSGGSGFRAATVWECPRKAALKLLGWRMKYVSTPLWFGNLIHRHALTPYLDGGKPEPTKAAGEVTDVSVAGKVTDTLETPDGKEIRVEKDIEPGTEAKLPDLENLARNQIQVWREKRYDPATVQACEQCVACPLADPDGNVPSHLDGFRLACRVDLALLIEAASRIVDLKTAGKPIVPDWRKHYSYHLQLSRYRFIIYVAGIGETDDLALFPLTKHKTISSIRKYASEIRLGQPQPYPKVYSDFAGTAVRLLQYAEARSWPENRHACKMEFGTCEFLPLCHWDQYDNPEEWKLTLYRRQEG
jgi:hypothetical protein